MNCKKCGSLITENDKFCKGCGSLVEQQNTVTPQVNQEIRTENVGYQQPRPVQPVQPTQPVQPAQPAQPVQPVQPVQPQQPVQRPVVNPVQQPTQQPYTQPNGYQQQNSWNNSYNTSTNSNQNNQKNNDNLKYILLGVGIVLVIAIIFIVSSVLNNNDSSNGSENNNTTQNSSGYKVNYNGIDFNIPDHLIYEKSDGDLLIGDELSTWVVNVEVMQGSFEQIKENKNQIQLNAQKQGYTASAAEEKTIGGVNFVTLEVSKGGQNVIVAYAKINSMYVLAVTALNQDNEFDYDILEEIAPVIKSATYTGETNNIQVDTNLDISNLFNETE